jgi:hypothetical protein
MSKSVTPKIFEDLTEQSKMKYINAVAVGRQTGRYNRPPLLEPEEIQIFRNEVIKANL